MRGQTKASSAGSRTRQAGGLGHIFRGAFVTRGASSGADGSGAPALASLLALVTTACLLLFATSAQAAPPTTIASQGKGAGGVEVPVGTAVRQAEGVLYVADKDNRRIDKFDSDGNFLLAWGFGVADGVSAELQTCGPEATPPTERCFKNDFFNNMAADNVRPAAVAVDQSTGDVYVVDKAASRVAKFTSSGEFLFVVGKNVNTTPGTLTPDLCTAANLTEPGAACGQGDTGSGAGEFFTSPVSATVDSAGHLWVGDTDRVIQFDSTGAYVSQAPLAGYGVVRALAREPGGDFYAIKPGVNEQQKVTFTSFVSGDTFTIGNLPPTCTAPSTDPIVYATGETGRSAVRAALVAKCGVNTFGAELNPPSGPTLTFQAVLGIENFPLMTCSKASGAGSCTVGAMTDGVPNALNRLEASGAPVSTLIQKQTVYEARPEAFALDPAGNVYVGDRTHPYRLLRFDPAGTETSQFGIGQVTSNPNNLSDQGPVGNTLAVHGGSESLFVASGLPNEDSTVQRFALPAEGPLIEGQRAEDVLPTSATLVAGLNPEGNETEYFFEYGTDESYGESTPTETLPGTGFDEEPVSAELEGLTPDTEYHFRLVATNHCKPSEPAVECTVAGPDTTFTTRPAVSIDAQWATGVAARSATLHAELDPLGVAAQWWIEFGTTDSYGQSTAENALPAGFGAVSVSTLFRDLTPGTTYHYRFVARDERDGTVYTVHGADKTFTTQPAALGFELADDRAWEMVTPPNKFSAVLWPANEGQVQAAPDGGALTFLTLNSIEAEPEGSRSPERASALARRDTAGSWSATDISAPNTGFQNLTSGIGAEYVLFSADLWQAVNETRVAAPLSPEASERTPYLRANSESPTYTPLVTGKEGFANVPPGTVFGKGGEGPVSAVRARGATADLGHVLLKACVPLKPGDANGGLYDWVAGQPPAQQLRRVSVLPGEEVAVAGDPGFGDRSGSIRNAISVDGSRVFWTTNSTTACGSKIAGLYLRDMQREESVRLDEVQPGAFGTGDANPRFQGADKAGTVAFFTDTRNLTADANESGSDLYRCLVKIEGDELKCELTNLTAQTVSATESAEVQGLTAAVSGDGKSVYFVARGVLDPDPNAMGESAISGQPNFYLWREGEVRFIAGLAEQDSSDWGSALSGVSLYNLTATASPSGRYLAFMSQRSLTGYDNRDAKSGELAQEVFLFDASGSEGQGQLICASCNPAGTRPLGLSGADEFGVPPFFDPLSIWRERPLAATLPEATLQQRLSNNLTFYRPRALHDNGRLFFNAADALVAADSNGEWDVYQYEPTGTGSCSASSSGAAVARTGGGCVALISSGTGEEESAFLDASEGGDDVFFYTSAQLSVNDEDQQMDIYDARVDGVTATLSPRAECLGEACQPAAGAPDTQTPASAAFRGPGNLAERADCGAAGRRAAKLSRRAKRLLRAGAVARRKGRPGLARQRSRKAARIAKQARRQSQNAKRCRRANRRAAR